MINTSSLWRDDCTWVSRDGAIRMSLFALALTAAGAFYLDARNDLYEEMSKRQRFTEVASEDAPVRL